jgi:CRP-like cAMP-binding protein
MRFGEWLFRENKPARYFYCVQSGRLILTKRISGFHEEIVDCANAGDMLGIDSITHGNLYNYSAKIFEEAVICRISKSEFIRQSRQHPELMFNLLKRLSKHISSPSEEQ